MGRHAQWSVGVTAGVLGALCAIAGCSASTTAAPASSRSIGAATRVVSSPTSSHVPSLPVAASTRPKPAPPPSSASSTPPAAPPRNRPVIVIDPGHSPTVSAVDPATGLNVSDYENEPEMRDVFSVAAIVRARLRAAGYRVVMTKTTPTDRVSLGQRAAIANRVHAALALSIHDQAGPNGGLPFHSSNNIVYYQFVGDYRETPNGTKVYFTDRRVAAVSKRYGQIFESTRERVEQHPVALQSNVGYDLGSRGLAPGNIWLVQLLSHVPWIYNEAGGNSAGMSGLDAADKHTYADGLVAAVERCVPPPR